jgi:hypothetical protein
MKAARGSTTRNVVIVLLHGLVLWALCGALIGAGRPLMGVETTLIVHVLAVPVFTSLIALSYFRRHGRYSPLATAAIFTGFVVSLDARDRAPIEEARVRTPRRRKGEEDQFERRSLIVFKEDLPVFLEASDKAIGFIKPGKRG